MKRSLHVRWLIVGAGLVAASFFAVPFPASSQAQHLEQFSAFVVNLQGARPGEQTMSGVLQITIDRWSTEAERLKLIEAFESGGQDDLLRELGRQDKVGYARLPTTIGYDLRFAREIPAPDGSRRIILATDRQMTMYELTNRPITTDYPFTLIELRLDKENRGEGRLSALTKIKTNRKEQVIELENYGDAPARLTEVKPIG
jgi:hypothetical protein